jgi:hypothetical protein
VVELSNRRLESAERLFHEALAVSPRSHRPITNLITIWSTQQGVLHTADQLVALAERDPGFTYPFPIAARAYLEADQPARAESTARLALTALPDSPLPYRDVALLYAPGASVDIARALIAHCERLGFASL